MSQPRPIVRQLYRPALIPQFAAIALLALVLFCLFPALKVVAIFGGAGIYYVVCRVTRLIFVHDHTAGMLAYKAGRFQEAINHFQASRIFFCAHPKLDEFRALIFGVASYNPYRVIALGNMAYCYGQLGDKTKAIGLYEQVLREAPGHAVAHAMLNLLRPAHSPSAQASIDSDGGNAAITS